VSAPTRPKPAPKPARARAAAPAPVEATTKLPTVADARPRGKHAAPSAGLALREPKQVVAGAGSAIVAAAKVGRIFGRSYLRVAKQLPGARVVEREAVRLGHALADLRKLLDMPTAVFGIAGSADEQRVMMLVQNAQTDAQPLRSAMSELLDRSADSDRASSRDYLYGSIVSQLVPDEARILAVLASGVAYAAADVVAKQGRSSTHTLLSNASTVGHAANATMPDNTPTYLTRLHGFGLVEFGSSDDALSTQYDLIAVDPVVVAARTAAETARQGSVRIRRKSVTLTQLGRDFWAACAPSSPALP